MLEVVPLLNRTASGQLEFSAALPNMDLIESMALLLDVTAAATLAGDTLNLRVQGLYDLSDAAQTVRAADDFVSFTQVLGNGGAKQFFAKWRRDVTPTTPTAAPVADGLAAASVVQGRVPKGMGAFWVIVGTGNFTFRLLVGPVMRRR